MKIIDLLNKIANNEEVPNAIVYNTRIFRYNQYNKCYIWNCNGTEYYLSTYYRLENILNDEIEIIEEKPKKIEEVVSIELLGQCDNWLQHSGTEEKSCMELNPYILETITRNFILLYHKQCELTKAVNYLLEKESE